MTTAAKYRAAVAAMARLGRPEFSWTQHSDILGGRVRCATIRARHIAETAPAIINLWLTVALEHGLALEIRPAGEGEWELCMVTSILEADWKAAAEESVAIARAAAASGRTVVAVGSAGPAFAQEGGARC